MRLVTLIENTRANEKLRCEHGLCFYLEQDGKKFLIDSGASDKLFVNAKYMKIDLSGLDCIMVSHNHYDHTGGLETLIRRYPDLKIYAKAACNNQFFHKNGLVKYELGLIDKLYRKYPSNFILYNNFQQISENIFMVSNEVNDESLACCESHHYKLEGQKLVRDDYEHEAFIVIFPDGIKENGCVIISSCSHCGIVNIIKTVLQMWPKSPILGVVGGFHLMGSSKNSVNCTQEYLDILADKLAEMDTGAIYTCHCTGDAAYNILKEQLGDKIQYLRTGEELLF